MRLKPSADFAAFLKKAGECEGAVLLKTADGDTLDLRSALCQLIALVSLRKQQAGGELTVCCAEERDTLRLAEFLDE